MGASTCMCVGIRVRAANRDEHYTREREREREREQRKREGEKRKREREVNQKRAFAYASNLARKMTNGDDKATHVIPTIQFYDTLTNVIKKSVSLFAAIMPHEHKHATAVFNLPRQQS